jgi:hypothetical protein
MDAPFMSFLDICEFLICDKSLTCSDKIEFIGN